MFLLFVKCLKGSGLQKNHVNLLQVLPEYLPLQPGKSYTASSLRILQGLIAAKVAGCSGAI
jgi:hypothetical protein